MALISRWALDGNALDSVGTNDGTEVGTVVYTPAEKISGNYSFKPDGGANYISVQDFNLFDYTNFTVAGWFIDTDGFSMLFTNNKINSNESMYAIYVSPLNIYIADSAWNSLLSYASTYSLSYGWHHFVVSDANGTIQAYIDGKLLGQPSYTRPEPITGPLTIGAFISSGSYYFTGNLDDFRFYDTALTETEVKALYNSYFTEKAAGMMPFIG